MIKSVTMWWFSGVVALCVVTFGIVLAEPDGATATVTSPNVPDIKGTYKLVMRKLPNGRLLGEPDIHGILTFTEHHRSTSVYWKGSSGRISSVAYVADYQLTEREYRETNRGFVTTANGKVVDFDLSSVSGSSPVKRVGDRVSIQLPLHGEPSLEFSGEFLVARGVFGEDTWRKVAEYVPLEDEPSKPLQPNDVEGIYKWIGHTRSDGGQAEPPEIQGLLVMTGSCRAFNMFWTDRDGINRSVSYFGKYALSSTDYIGTTQMLVWSRGDDAFVDSTVATRHSSVRQDGEFLGFQPSIAKEAYWKFDGLRLKLDDGESINIWKKSD